MEPSLSRVFMIKRGRLEMHENWARPRYKSNLLGKKMRTCKIIGFDSHVPMPYLSLGSHAQRPWIRLRQLQWPIAGIRFYFYFWRRMQALKSGVSGMVSSTHAMQLWIIAHEICPMPSSYFSPGRLLRMRYAQCLVHI